MCAIGFVSTLAYGQQGKDMGYGFCPLHRLNYKGAGCPKCAASGGTATGSSASPQNQMAMAAAGMLGTAIGEWLRGDPQREAQLAAEAQARAREQQRAAQIAAAEAARKKNEDFSRLRGMLKLDSFDGDSGGGLVLKGVDVGSGGGLALKLDDSGNEPGLKFDDDLKPLSTRASANSGPANSPAPHTDPMVVDLRNLKKSAYLIRSFETAAPENAPVLLEQALNAANGDQSLTGGIPSDTALPPIDENGFLAFQKANGEYRKANDFEMKCTETFQLAQERRELGDRIAQAARADLELAKTRLTNEVTLKGKQQQMTEIFAATKALDEAYARARAEVEAARNRNYAAKEEAVRVMRAAAAGKDPASFHPPIASLPGLDEKTWLQVQEKMIAERIEFDRQKAGVQLQLQQMEIPVPLAYERVHEVVILGADTDAGSVREMESVKSPWTNKTPPEMNQAAEEARKNGKEGVGGAMVVSFGTLKTGTAEQVATEVVRVAGDHFTEGQISLNTPQGKAVVEALSGKEIGRLIVHSNGTPIAEALIQDERNLIKVNELNVVGGDRSLLNGHMYQKLLDSGKVKRVVVWLNVNDPIMLTAIDQLKPAERTNNAIEHIARKITGDLAGGDSRVKYHFMVGPGESLAELTANRGLGLLKPHYLTTGYYDNIRSELGHPSGLFSN